MTLVEIAKRTGLTFPPGSVLVGSYLDFFLQGRSWAARIEVPRARFHQFRASIPKDAHDFEAEFFPNGFYGKEWWTPQGLKPFLLVGFGHNRESVMLLADKSRGDVVVVLIWSAN